MRLPTIKYSDDERRKKTKQNEIREGSQHNKEKKKNRAGIQNEYVSQRARTFPMFVVIEVTN